MLDRPRFWLYRNLVALMQWRSFTTAEVIPLAPPVDGSVRFRPFAERHPDYPCAASTRP